MSLPLALTIMSPAIKPDCCANLLTFVIRRPVVSASFDSASVSTRASMPRRCVSADEAELSAAELVPIVISSLISFLSRITVSSAFVPGRSEDTSMGSDEELVTLRSFKAVITSPAFSPAFSAGLPFSILVTSAPSGVFSPKLSARSWVTCWI